MIALGIGLEEFEYPHPVQFLPLSNDLQPVTMAYMDVPPSTDPNGQAVVLFHGKAFGCYYFRNLIEALTGAGYRVVAPDQIGWGKSAKPDIHYSFQLLAANTATLLDHLGVGQVAVLGHSTGGMTGTRFTLMNPDRVTHLILEDPLGLTDYRTGIPPQSEQTLYDHEVHWTDPAVIRAYVAGYFVHPDPKVWEPLADVLVRVTLSPDYPRWARAAALTFQMIYQQPVRYEYHLIVPPTLLVVGAEDHVVPLGQYAQPAAAARLGDFIALSAAAAQDIPRATRVVIPDCGHIPHLEQPSQFLDQLLPFLEDDHVAGLYRAAFPPRDREPGDETALALRRSVIAAEFWTDPGAANATLPDGLTPDPETSGHGLAMFIDWQFNGSRDEYLDPLRSQYREFFVLLDARWQDTPVGVGFRFELAYTVTDLRTLS